MNSKDKGVELDIHVVYMDMMIIPSWLEIGKRQTELNKSLEGL